MVSSSGSPATSDEIYESMRRVPATSDEIYQSAQKVPRYLARRPPPCCKHGMMVQRMSRTNRNPGRRFYSCWRSGAPGGCDIVDWIDEELTDHYKGYILEVTDERNLAREQLRTALLREELNSNQVQPLRNERNEANKRIAEFEKNLEDLDCELVVLQEKIDSLEATVDAQKMKIRVLKYFVWLFVIILACILSSKA